MSDAASEQGCQWIVGRVRKWNAAGKAYNTVPIHCLKLVAPDSCFCPKHKLLAQELNQEQHRSGVYEYDRKG